jgi:DNA-binding NarL/FixJ family response regulator
MSKQIAFDLGLNVQTVKAHRCAVMQKMAAQTLTELVRMADALALHATGLRSSKYLQQRVVGSTA